MRIAMLLVGAMVGILACGNDSPTGSTSGQLTLGTWGGTDAGVIVTDSVVHVHVGCTFGDMPPGIVVDDRGRFTVDGSYVLRAYPVVMGPRLPAQFSGQVIGRRLTLAVAVNDTTTGRVVALGPVTVTLGKEPQMGPCPICAAPRIEGLGFVPSGRAGAKAGSPDRQ